MIAKLQELITELTPDLIKRAREICPEKLRDQFDKSAIISIVYKNIPIYNIEIGDKDHRPGWSVILRLENYCG